jgi:integrase
MLLKSLDIIHRLRYTNRYTMPRVATKLTPRSDGSWFARKRIPADVRAAYGKLFGGGWEVRFHCTPMPVGQARALHREWLNDIEGRINNIRAERAGEGRALTPKEARGLAGDWYRWFTAKHEAEARSAIHWDTLEGLLVNELSGTTTSLLADGLDAPTGLNLARELERPEVRQELWPVVADYAETAQFLHSKHLTLDDSSRHMFLDWVVGDLFAAVRLLKNRADGDYSQDERLEQFPKFERAGDPGLTPWKLFERWTEKTKPARATIDRWRGVFLDLDKHFGSRSAATLTRAEADDWAQSRITPDRSAGTVKDVWVNAATTVFKFAVDKGLLNSNPFIKIRIPVPRKTTTRDSGKAFTSDEAKVILSASLAISAKTKGDAAKRWLPPLCAYTGARSGEIAQLRSSDVVEREEIHAIKITPEAGTVKTGQARVVPLHPHLIELGFLEFVKASGAGPLFYNVAKAKPVKTNPTNPPKPRYVKVREHVGAWVRDLGVSDPELLPNHAWRHTFKQIGHRAGISERLLDAIVGHAPATVGKGYGVPTLSDKADALAKFPRYDLTRSKTEGEGTTRTEVDEGIPR